MYKLGSQHVPPGIKLSGFTFPVELQLCLAQTWHGGQTEPMDKSWVALYGLLSALAPLLHRKGHTSHRLERQHSCCKTLRSCSLCLCCTGAVCGQ